MSIPHGTPGGYSNHSCRCSECREAWRVYYAAGGYRKRYQERNCSGPCLTSGCDRRRDQAYVTGYCHRCNVEMGKKPDPRVSA